MVQKKGKKKLICSQRFQNKNKRLMSAMQLKVNTLTPILNIARTVAVQRF